MYRSALAVRRAHPALGAGDSVEWLAAPDGVLAFRREPRGGGEAFVCVANTTGAAVRVTVSGRVLLTSSAADDIEHGDGHAVVPADTTVWWTV
jgi:alpha-glucosidase